MCVKAVYRRQNRTISDLTHVSVSLGKDRVSFVIALRDLKIFEQQNLRSRNVFLDKVILTSNDPEFDLIQEFFFSFLGLCNEASHTSALHTSYCLLPRQYTAAVWVLFKNRSLQGL